VGIKQFKIRNKKTGIAMVNSPAHATKHFAINVSVLPLYIRTPTMKFALVLLV